VSRASQLRLLVLLALVGAFALGTLLPAAFGRSEAAPTAIRSALAQTDHVQGAPGRSLVLSRVVVEPGAELALHHHLGTQVARIQSGVLTYTVRRGSVVVRRGESDQQPETVRTIKAGQTGRIRAGQWIVEQPSDVHQAANVGSTPVVIYLATLLKTGAPPATPVTLPGPAASSSNPVAGAATFRGRNGPIAFRSDAGNTASHESHAIWRVKPDGTGAKRITRGSDPAGFEDDYSPVFFADGRRFAYIRQVANREFAVENQIYVKSVSAPANALGSPVFPAPVDYRILSLSVSPDGHRLALAAAPPPLGETQIFTINLAGGEIKELTLGPGAARTPEFSPDGRRIVFASRFLGKGGLSTVDPESLALRQLTSNPGDGAPSYSPSGDRIVFNGHSGHHTRIFSIRAGGGDRTQLTNGPFVDRGPVFSPDGRSIAFSRSGGKRNPDLYVMHVDGTGAHLLYASPGKLFSDFGPDWGPKPR
jgi:Tol biopolymer transport system component/quercetin dioxygenase-like cupin family protein